MISSLEWIPAGVADPNPKKYELSATEQELMEMLQEKGSLNDHIATVEASLDDKNHRRKPPRNKEHLATATNASLPADLRMDEYSSDEDDEDDDDEDENDDENDGITNLEQTLDQTALSAVGDMMDDNDSEGKSGGEEDERPLDDDNDDDAKEIDSEDDEDLDDIPDTREYEPIDVEGLEAMGLSHVGMNDASAFMNSMDRNENGDDDSEAEDVLITADDALLVIAKAEDDFASLEIYVYDQRKGYLYVHHDIPLPAFPLCLAHGQVSRNGSTGNFCAVGTFSPGIEIWNLDVLNALEPSCVLGGEDTSIADDMMKLEIMKATKGLTNGAKQQSTRRKGSSRSKPTGLRPGSHTDAVMALSWNLIHKQVLASGSADGTVKLWDVTKASGTDGVNAATFRHHKNKVQSVAWNPNEGSLLATGSYDRTVAVLDARSGGGGTGSTSNVKSVRITADCEALAWDPFHPECLTVVAEDGTISCWDVRKFETSTPLWSFVASEFGGVTDVSYNTKVPGLMVTCSIDKTVTLWDAHNAKEMKGMSPPRSCGSKDMCAGKLYAVGFYPSSPWLLGCGGSGNQLSIWDLSSEEAIQRRFEGRVSGQETSRESRDEKPPLLDPEKPLLLDQKTETTSTISKKHASEHSKKKGKAKKKAHKRS